MWNQEEKTNKVNKLSESFSYVLIPSGAVVSVILLGIWGGVGKVRKSFPKTTVNNPGS